MGRIGHMGRMSALTHYVLRITNRPLLILAAAAVIGVSSAACAGQVALEHLFTVDKYDGNRRFVTPVAVFYDSVHQEIYVADSGKCSLVILDRNGGYLGAFYHRRKGQNEKIEPVGIAVNSKRDVLVTDPFGDRVWMYDYLGNPTGSLPIPRVDTAASLPGKMAVDADDVLYVTLRNAGKIAVIAPDGRVKAQVGDSNVESCCDAALDGKGNIYALSRAGTAVHIFDAEGRRVRKFGDHSLDSLGFSQPAGIDIDSKGRIWVVDSIGQVIKAFSSDGTYLQMIGGLGPNDGEFFYPIDLCIDKVTDTLFVVEKTGRRIQAFRIVEK